MLSVKPMFSSNGITGKIFLEISNACHTSLPYLRSIDSLANRQGQLIRKLPIQHSASQWLASQVFPQNGSHQIFGLSELLGSAQGFSIEGN